MTHIVLNVVLGLSFITLSLLLFTKQCFNNAIWFGIIVFSIICIINFINLQNENFDEIHVDDVDHSGIRKITNIPKVVYQTITPGFDLLAQNVKQFVSGTGDDENDNVYILDIAYYKKSNDPYITNETQFQQLAYEYGKLNSLIETIKMVDKDLYNNLVEKFKSLPTPSTENTTTSSEQDQVETNS